MSGANRAAWFLLLAALAPSNPRAADAPRALRIELRAREIAPGEPLRVLVESTVPLVSLRGEFLDRPVYFVRDEASIDGRRWAGWTMVDLDRAPGPAVVELIGDAGEGRRVPGTHAVTIADKPFPEENLSVAPRYVEPPPEVRRRLQRERELLEQVYRQRSDRHLVGGAFVRPVPGEPTSIFGTRRLFNGEPRSPHPGVDLRAASGTPVAASGDGTVRIARDLYYSGNTVILDHGGGLFTIYAHLSEIAVAEGDEIAAGATLGKSGATGRVTGPHLHWGAKIGDRPFDPAALLDPRLSD
jgi:murein DD-endopeptidase MepM/ murein hydrolase activator NlpD